MPFQARLGDISSHGGIIITAAARTLVDGRPVARLLDLHVCPIPLHGITPIITGAVRTLTEGLPNARVGRHHGLRCRHPDGQSHNHHGVNS